MNTTTIFVDNISANTTVFDLEIIFGASGLVRRVHIPTNERTGANRGIAFVSMASNAEAEEAMFSFQGYRYDYMIWNLSWAKPKKNNSKKMKQHEEQPKKKKNEAETTQDEIKKKERKQKKKKHSGTKQRTSSFASNASTVPTIASSLGG
jgi:RNA recognition motif-containing protein